MNPTSTRQAPRPGRRPATPEEPVQIAATADVDPNANVSAGVTIWHLAQVREYAQLGTGCFLGRGSYVGPGVIVGRYCRVQNFAQLYEPALVEDGVLIGAGAILTGEAPVRAVNPDGSRVAESEHSFGGVTVRTGASIGARAVCVAPITIGQWAIISPGAIVTQDVPDYALMEGVPARQVGWVDPQGNRLEERGDGIFSSPENGALYREHELETGTVLVPV
jgi:UDP-2-acetamido-3-amino-2,3-dideoxy-glucuronate N-acetyltransferase